MTAPNLTGQQRRALRALAHKLQPIVQVGQGGAGEGVIRAIDEALLAHELIKVRMHEPEDKKAAAQSLADASESSLCGLIGHTVILYRPHPETPRIKI
jgi:RNA-binding protein